jgi:hypothetical protein
MMMKFQLVREEVFTFSHNDGTKTYIRSGELREWLLEEAMNKVIPITFPEESLESIIARHGLEESRIASMTILEASEPVVVGDWGGTHVLIDGGHRRYYWAKQGIHTIRGWAVPQQIWEMFLYDPEAPNIIHHHTTGQMLPHRRGKL